MLTEIFAHSLYKKNDIEKHLNNMLKNDILEHQSVGINKEKC